MKNIVFLDFEGFTSSSLTKLRFELHDKFNSMNIMEKDNRIPKEIDASDISCIAGVVSCFTNLFMLYFQYNNTSQPNSTVDIDKFITEIHSQFSPYLNLETLIYIENEIKKGVFPIVFVLDIKGVKYRYEAISSSTQYLLRGRIMK
jgi:hypothetical protein